MTQSNHRLSIFDNMYTPVSGVSGSFERPSFFVDSAKTAAEHTAAAFFGIAVWACFPHTL